MVLVLVAREEDRSDVGVEGGRKNTGDILAGGARLWLCGSHSPDDSADTLGKPKPEKLVNHRDLPWCLHYG